MAGIAIDLVLLTLLPLRLEIVRKEFSDEGERRSEAARRPPRSPVGSLADGEVCVAQAAIDAADKSAFPAPYD